MINIRFSQRHIKRGLVYFGFAIFFYYVYSIVVSNDSAGVQSLHRGKEELEAADTKSSKLPVAIYDELKTIRRKVILDLDGDAVDEKQKEIGKRALTFEGKDMTDEHENTYKIGIWMVNSGNPGNLANPKECQDNVYCDISYTKQNSAFFHAIVFKAEYLKFGIPTIRYPNQLFAWWTGESPLHTSLPPTHLDDKFNLTFHYRTDADIYDPFGSMMVILKELKEAGEVELDDLLQKKRRSGKMAAWAVSNCYGKRLEYAKSLINAGLAVDTFGSCFEHHQLGQGRYSDSMYEQLSEYKFYFAFENSITCKDYFTEKFWFNGLRSGAVPIVWGPSKNDLLKVVPYKSFIHAEDFSSPKELVEYLNYLAKNETAYAEYLQWRTWIKNPERMEDRLKVENRDNDMRSYCKLCSILQADGRRKKLGILTPPRIIPSIKKAWIEPDKYCHD